MSSRSNKRRVANLFHRRFHSAFIWRSAEDFEWLNMTPVGREFGSPDYERLEVLDLYSYGVITSSQALQRLALGTLDALHAQMLDAEIAIPVPGVEPVLKGLFAQQVCRTVSIADMNKAIADAASAEFHRNLARAKVHKHRGKSKTNVAAINLLADEAKRAADASIASIDDAIEFVNESNFRIASLESRLKEPWRVVEVQVIAELSLQVGFADGVQGTVKFEPTHLTGVFAVLKDPEFFSQVRLEIGVVTWPGELDLAPDAMYEEIKAHGGWVLR